MSEKQRVTWDELVAFAREVDRDVTHVFRCVKGERVSPPLAEAFLLHFGFPMQDAALAGRRPLGQVIPRHHPARLTRG